VENDSRHHAGRRALSHINAETMSQSCGHLSAPTITRTSGSSNSETDKDFSTLVIDNHPDLHDIDVDLHHWNGGLPRLAHGGTTEGKNG